MGASRGVPEEMAKHVAKLVNEHISEHFPGVAETAVAREAGIVQPVLSEVRRVKGSLGMATLIKLRNWLQIPLDDLLGLPPLSSQASTLESIDRRLAAIQAAATPSTPVPRAPEQPVTPDD